jgi:hypothetical protein
MDQQGLLILRRNLDAFIRADPVNVVFSRSTPVQTLAGGHTKGVPTQLASQQFRFVPFKRRLSSSINNTQDGPLSVTEYVLVGRHNVDVQKGDEFFHNSRNYKVTEIEPRTDDRSTTDRVTIALEVRD